MVPQLLHTRHGVVVQLVWSQEVCKSFRMCLNLLAVNTATQTTSDATTINLNAHQLIPMACHIYMASLLSSNPKPQCILQAPLSREVTLVLDRINLKHMADMRQRIAMQVHPLNQFKEWFQDSR